MSRRLTIIEVEIARLAERLHGLDRLADEKFVRFGTMMDAQAAKVALALDASKEAIGKAERSTERAIEATAADVKQRFASVNEFRQTLSDQATTFIPRAEAESRIAAVVERLELQREQVAAGDTKLDERLKALEQGSSNLQGRIWALGATIAAVVVLVNIAIALLTR